MNHGSSPPPILGGDLKILGQKKWGGAEKKINFGGDLVFRGALKFKGGAVTIYITIFRNAILTNIEYENSKIFQTWWALRMYLST